MKKKLVLTAFLVIFLIISVCIFYHRPLQSAKIMITSDIHYLSDKLHDDDLAYQHMLSNSDGRLTQYCDVILSAFIEEVLQQKPDVLIISGDLSFNGEKLSHQDLAAKLHVLYDGETFTINVIENDDINNIIISKSENMTGTIKENSMTISSILTEALISANVNKV